jgi:hypothetical protein
MGRSIPIGTASWSGGYGGQPLVQRLGDQFVLELPTLGDREPGGHDQVALVEHGVVFRLGTTERCTLEVGCFQQPRQGQQSPRLARAFLTMHLLEGGDVGP